MPTETINHDEQMGILDFLASLSIIKSKSEARRLIEQGGIIIDGEKQNDANKILSLNPNQEIVVQKGKKSFVKVVIK